MAACNDAIIMPSNDTPVMPPLVKLHKHLDEFNPNQPDTCIGNTDFALFKTPATKVKKHMSQLTASSLDAHDWRRIGRFLIILLFLACILCIRWFYDSPTRWIKPEHLDERIESNDDMTAGENQLLSPDELRGYSQRAYSIYEEDKTVNPVKEIERCRRYGYRYDGRTSRRRVFWGSLLADDSWQTIYAHAAEAYGIYHTAAFVESNTTQTLSPRKLRFSPKSRNLSRLMHSNAFGPDTKVTVDYYIDGKHPPKDGLLRENMQRQDILKRWKTNGMRPDDIGFLSDVDEVFTRDFLRALQICSIPQFQVGQDCREPKIFAYSMVFEASPNCIVPESEFVWYHPDVIIGECVELIGDNQNHISPLRNAKDGFRVKGHGYRGPDDYKKYEKMIAKKKRTDKISYPLWNAADFRMTEGGDQLTGKKGMLQTGFHLHNFFESVDELRNKYLTFGHPHENALSAPLSSLNENLRFTVECVKQRTKGFTNIVGPRPIFFEDQEYRKKRQELMKQMIKNDEKIHGTASKSKST